MKPVMSFGSRKLVEERFRRAALVGTLNAPLVAKASAYWPVITISREPCAGGTTIARALAERLGFACWDQELLTRIASESGALESVLSSVDERVSSRVTDFIRSLTVGFEYTQNEYRAVLTKVVGAIAAQGAAVVVGRGGHFILGQSRCLRVRIVCPVEERVRRMSTRDGVTEAAAHRRVRELGAEVAAFMRHHFDKEVASPENYDVLVNSGTLDVAQAADLIVTGYRHRFGAIPLVAQRPPHASAIRSNSYVRVLETGT